MAFKVVRSRDSIKDIDLIFDHLVGSYANLGDAPAEAVNRATNRIRAIKADMNAIAVAPYQGTLLDKTSTGLRSVTKNRAIFYFEVDDEAQVIRILAIFFGGQDHQRHILKRLSQGG